MEEQLISFKTAKLAKEKGLEDGIKCTGLYCIGHGSFKSDENLMKFNYFRDSVKGQFHLALAPTQSLLQKWLREKHKLYISVNCCVYDDPERYSSQLSGYGKKDIFMPVMIDGFTIFATYEEALEEGLQEALKLIS